MKQAPVLSTDGYAQVWALMTPAERNRARYWVDKDLVVEPFWRDMKKQDSLGRYIDKAFRHQELSNQAGEAYRGLAGASSYTYLPKSQRTPRNAPGTSIGPAAHVESAPVATSSPATTVAPAAAPPPEAPLIDLPFASQPSPPAVTTTNPAMQITEESERIFHGYYDDRGNWGGRSLVGGNFGGTKEERGNLTQLKIAGLLTTDADERGQTWITFTSEGHAFEARTRPTWEARRTKAPLIDLPFSRPASPTPASPVGAPLFIYDGDEQMKDYVLKDVTPYFPQVVGDTTDIEILLKAVARRWNCLLLGETGLGKTSAMQTVAYKLQMPYFSLNLNGGITVEDFVGSWVPKASGGFGWQDGILTRFVKFGGLLVLEEINAANPEVLFALHGLLDDNRQLVITADGGKKIIANRNFAFAATMNPDYEGTQPLNKAFFDRFQVVLEYTGQNIPQIIQDSKLSLLYEKVAPQIENHTLIGVLSVRGLKQYKANREVFGPDIARRILLEKIEKGQSRDSFKGYMEGVDL